MLLSEVRQPNLPIALTVTSFLISYQKRSRGVSFLDYSLDKMISDYLIMLILENSKNLFQKQKLDQIIMHNNYILLEVILTVLKMTCLRFKHFKIFFVNITTTFSYRIFCVLMCSHVLYIVCVLCYRSCCFLDIDFVSGSILTCHTDKCAGGELVKDKLKYIKIFKNLSEQNSIKIAQY